MKMPGKPFWWIFFIILFFSFSSDLFAEMASEHYRIRSSVQAAGGVPIGSANYQINSTIGQSSPLPDASDPPMSNSYDLYPGFWYTLSTGLLPCQDLSSFARAFGTTDLDDGYNISCDFEPDGDLDGVDLANFLQGYPL
jgi:hypothetical protein